MKLWQRLLCLSFSLLAIAFGTYCLTQPIPELGGRTYQQGLMAPRPSDSLGDRVFCTTVIPIILSGGVIMCISTVLAPGATRKRRRRSEWTPEESNS